MKSIGPLSYRFAAVVFATVLIACNTEPKIGPPATITKAGDAQTAAAGKSVPIAPSVTILDANGRGVPNIAVTFAVASGGGSITGGMATTDATGTAALTNWTLGTIAGPNTLTASAVGVPGSPVTFTATGVPGPATTITKIGVDPAIGPAGGNIDSIVVLVTDAFGNPVAGETVTFAVTAGGGSVSPTSRVTLADGRAAARWTLGTSAGTVNTATATRAGLASPTVTFSTTTVRAVASIKFASTTLVVDSLGTITPTVTVFNQSGTPETGAQVTLTSRNPNVATAGSTTVSGVKSGQTFLIATSVDNPSVMDSALVIVARIASPVVTVSVPRFDLKTDTTFTVAVVVDMRASGEKLGAATLEVTWDPAVLTYVSNADGSSGVGATVNTSKTATGLLTMAMASSAGFAGAVEFRKVTFKASATPARIGPLAVNVIDLSGAGTFTNLQPRTVSGSYSLRTR